MFKYVRPGLRRVTTSTRLLLGGKCRSSSANGAALVRLVTIGASDLAFNDGMMRCEIELPARIEMTLETDARRFAGIDHRVSRATSLDMETASTVTRFAADILGVRPFCHQSRMSRGWKFFDEFRMTFRTRRCADEFRTRNIGRRDHHALKGGAGDEHRNDQDEREDERDSTVSGKRAKL